MGATIQPTTTRLPAPQIHIHPTSDVHSRPHAPWWYMEVLSSLPPTYAAVVGVPWSLDVSRLLLLNSNSALKSLLQTSVRIFARVSGDRSLEMGSPWVKG